MRIRGNRRRRSVDRGFALTDHNDWEGVVDTSGAERILLIHDYSTKMARWLQEKGYDAKAIATAYGDMEPESQRSEILSAWRR